MQVQKLLCRGTILLKNVDDRQAQDIKSKLLQHHIIIYAS